MSGASTRGGNHGAFFRISTHSTLMFAGRDSTGIPPGLAISEPYDSLCFGPTVLALDGKLRSDGSVPADLIQHGFRKFPGPVIHEVLGAAGTGTATEKTKQLPPLPEADVETSPVARL